MTSATVEASAAPPAAAPASAPPAATRAPRLGLVAEFMLVGGATLVIFPLLWLLRAGVGLRDAELAVGFSTFYAAYLVNDPHFAVTYLLFYRGAREKALGRALPPAQRARYWLAGFVAPLALASWAIVALGSRSAATLGSMIQLMYLLVGFHYTKQGFGVLTVLCLRRGVAIDPRVRVAALAHCYAAWAFAWANPAVPAGLFEEQGVVFAAVARPASLELATGSILAASSVALVAALAAAWRRGRGVPIFPLAGFLITVWAWTVLSSVDPLFRYVFPALHSLQYLYFVWLVRRNEARAHEGPPAFGKPAAVRVGFLAVSATLLAWALFHGAPGFLDDAFAARTRRGARELGPTPYLAAFYVFVNLHHYFMDAVLWRRENPETRWLRDPPTRSLDAAG